MGRNIQISTKITFLVVGLTVVTLFFVLFFFTNEPSDINKPDVENGRIDLSNWDFEEDGNIKLDGNWDFYWNRIIMPEDISKDSDQLTGTYPVPLYWTKYEGLNLPSKGEATYRVEIKVDEKNDIMCLTIPELYTEYALWVNGQLIVGNGDLGGTSFRYLNPDTFMFRSENGRIEMILQIHNQAHVNAGIGQSFVLGTPDNILWRNSLETAIDLILVGICLFAGLYHFVLFLYRRTDYKLLCFTIFCVAVAIRGIMSNVTYIMEFFPQLPFLTGSRIVTISIPVLTVSMLLYTYYMFKDRIPKLLVQLLSGISAVNILIVLTTSSYTYSYLFYLYLIVCMMVCAIGLYVSICAIRTRSPEAVLFLVGAVFLIGGAVNDSLFYIQMIDTGYRLGVGLTAFAVIQSFIMALQYARFADEKKELYERLRKTDLAFMQAQIKPHFIYNALSAISHAVNKDPKKAKGLILDFSDYLRGCFDFSNVSGLTTLSKEMDIVKAYLSIEKARFQERLNVEYDIDENPHILIPMLCVQPIVENAVNHGLMQRAEGGTVKIKAWNENGDTHIRVEDDGVGISDKIMQDIFNRETSAVGIPNINGRLKLRFGIGLNISSKIKVGTTVELTIPKQATSDILD